jgi:hypothetical protein
VPSKQTISIILVLENPLAVTMLAQGG